MRVMTVCLLMIAGASFGAATYSAAEEFGMRSTWQPPTRPQVRAAIDNWIGSRKLNELEQLKLDALWPAESAVSASDDTLRDVAITISLLMPETQEIVDLCRGDRRSPVAPQFQILTGQATAPFVRHNLRLYYGRWLAQNELHDEALSLLDGLTVENVVDPAGLLFYRSVANHGLLNRDQCLASLQRLLENEQAIPKRYATLAQLMTADLNAQQKDKVLKTLDEVARMMADIERRQRLFRAGKRVRKQEEDVVAKLDELIKEMESRAPPPPPGPPGNAPTRPMEDSIPGGGSGPGNVDPRQLTPGGDWGDLPPKQREAAMAELAKDLPAHYREVIEEYFRNLARTTDQP